MIIKATFLRLNQVAGDVAPAIVILVSLLVMLGWFLGSVSLVQVSPSFAPMQFNTALSLLLSALALIGLHRAPRWPVLIFAIPAGVIGALTLFQYWLEVDLGIDELFVQHGITTKTSHPGRMSPNTAICFLLLNTAIMVWQFAGRALHMLPLVIVLCGIALSLSMTALFGYLAAIEDAYGWSEFTRMAVHTSLGFVLLSSTFLYSLLNVGNRRPETDRYYPYVVVYIGLLLTVLLGIALSSENQRSIQSVSDKAATSLRGMVLRVYGDQMRALERMASRLDQMNSLQDNYIDELWRRDAREYLQDHDLYRSIVWLRGDGRLLGEFKEPELGLPEVLNSIQSGPAPNQPASDIWKVSEGIYGVIERLPMEDNAYLVAYLALNSLIGNGLIQSRLEGFNYRLTVEGFPILRQELEPKENVSMVHEARLEFALGDRLVELSIAPSSGLVKELKNPFATLELILGSLLSLSIGYMAHLSLKSEQKNRQLEQSEASVRAVLEAVGQGVFGLDRTGKATFINPAAYRILGYLPGDHLGEPILQMIQHSGADDNPDSKEQSPLRRTLATGVACHISRDRWWHRDGTSIPVEYVATPVRDGNSITGAVIVFSDISERLAKENELLNKQSNLEAICQSFDDLYFWLDASDAIQEFRASNEKALYTAPDQFLGKRMQDILPPEVGGRFGEAIKAVRNESESSVLLDYQLVMEDGEVRYFEARLAPIHAGRLIVIVRDITSRKMVEAELIRISKYKSEFLANMSHEIRTPMNAILGLTQLVLGTTLKDQQRSYLEKVKSSSQSLLNILNDILDYSKIEADKLDIVAEDFDLEKLLLKTSGLYALSAEEKKVELLFDMDTDLNRTYRGDSMRIGQILNNIVSNAIKFTERGFVRVKVTEDNGEKDQVQLCFTVQDTGIGMTEEQASRLFQPFSQVDSSITRRYGGTGLGLTICKKLVDLMGGEIGVTSRPDQGSIFTFAIPVTKVPFSQLKTTPLKRMKTLVVDDQEDSLEIIAKILRSWRFEVYIASSGSEALEMIKRANAEGDPIQLFLIDWRMPEMDGVDLAMRVREIYENAGKPSETVVIMVTAYGRLQVQQAAAGVAIDGFLEKPVVASQLLNTLAELQSSRDKSEPSDVHDPLASDLDDLPELSEIQGAEVLLVEDNLTNQLLAADLLTHFGLKVTVAGNGREALEYFGKQSFDLVLMDIHMPVMDGLEATRRIRLAPGGQAIPILAMSAAAMEVDKNRALEAGMNAHIAKPIGFREFAKILIEYIKPGKQETVATQATSKDKPQEAFSMPGFDLQAAVARTRGNWNLLKRMCESFRKEFQSFSTELPALIENGPREEAVRLVHSLKGSSQAIGAITLSELAEELEHNLVSEADELDIRPVQEELDRVHLNIVQTLSEDTCDS